MRHRPKTAISSSLAICMLFLCIDSYAQNAGVIKGKLIDSVSMRILPYGTVSVYNAQDSSIITYRMSDDEGKFQISELPFHSPCRIIISYSGYRIRRLEFGLTADKSLIDFGIIYLRPDTVELPEMLVTAERPPVIVRNDTIEFNALAFKTLPNALVEDLLKKLPGVNVSRDGDITVNGRKVNRILVDGKAFFGNDHRIATRNLPANIIDKIQVTDDAEEAEADIFRNKELLGRVINLKLKKDIKRGIFGKLYAGAGTNDRHEAGGILNLFRDTLQLSLIGYTNNMNKPGFGMDEIKDIGGFSRGGYSSPMVTRSGSFALDGISFGATGDGIQNSTGTGFNMNTELSKSISLNLRYFFGQIDSKYEDIQDSRQHIGDTILRIQTNTSNKSRVINHKLGGILKWKIDKFSSLTIKPSITFGKNSNDRQVNLFSSNNFKGDLNKSIIEEMVRSRSHSFANDFGYRRTFKKAGRVFSSNVYFTAAHFDTDQLNIAENVFYNGSTSQTELNQLRVKDLPNLRFSFNSSFSEPLSSKVGLQLSFSGAYTKGFDRIETFGPGSSSGNYSVLIDSLTNGIERDAWKTVSTASMVFAIKKLRVTPGFSFQTLHLKNHFQKNPFASQKFNYLFPTISINWGRFYVSYTQNIFEPRLEYLQPLIDNTNPLFLRIGNSNLRPTVSHSVYAIYDVYNTKTASSYHALLNVMVDRDAIVFQREVTSNGIQIIKPVPVSGIIRVRSNLVYTKKFDLKNEWNLSLNGALYSELSRNKFIVNKITSWQDNLSLNPVIDYSFSWKDEIEINQRYAPYILKGLNDNSFFNDVSATTHQLTSEFVFRLKNSFVFESSLDNFFYPSISNDIHGSFARWNAAVHYSFLKQESATLKLTVFDILNTNQDITRMVTENYISDRTIMTLRRFLLLTFTYNIKNFSARKTGGRDRLLRF